LIYYFKVLLASIKFVKLNFMAQFITDNILQTNGSAFNLKIGNNFWKFWKNLEKEISMVV